MAIEQARPRQLELTDYIRILQKRKWFILLVTAAAAMVGGLYTISSEKVYTASSLVLVQQQPKGFFWITGKEANILPTVALDTYARIARSSDTAKLTVERLGAMPTSTRIVTTVEEVTEAIDVVVTQPDLLRIDARSPDPTKAMAFANYMADSFVQVNTEMRQMESKAAREFLEEQVAKAKEELDKAIAATIDLSVGTGLPDPEVDSQTLSTLLHEYENQERLASAEVDQTASRVAELEREVAKEQPVTVESRPQVNPNWDQIKNHLVAARIELSNLRAKYTEQHPLVQDARARVAELERELADTPRLVKADTVVPSPVLSDARRMLAEARVNHQAAVARYKAFKRIVREMREQVSKLPEKRQQWRSLTARAEAARQVYLDLQQELRQAKLSEAIKQGNAAVVDTATSARLVKASLSRALVFSIALGLFVGLGLGILLEALDDTIYSVDDLRRATDTPFLGVVPLRTDEAADLVTVAAPKSPPAEAYRTLRTNIRFSLFDTPAKTFVISSAGTGEGKSLTAANLAVAYAQSGDSVILVDTDLRRPVIHRTFGIESAPGLTNVLVSDTDLHTALVQSEVPGLKLLPAGPLPPNPAELIDSPAMEQLLHDLTEEADIVILDSPPALMLADAGILASKADCTIMVAESGQITQRALREMERTFQNARANVIGVILNKLRVTGGDYYYYYYYYYHDYSDRGEATNGNGNGKRKNGKNDALTEAMHNVVNGKNGHNGKSNGPDSDDEATQPREPTTPEDPLKADEADASGDTTSLEPGDDAEPPVPDPAPE
ncbi:MAG: polysaccharide biosynthesis tyrosine autokinase, partial [Armatimonadetes bacterium]|nr:polysaccharide biosynthesis tyrosine autokinase [Armatimonadota bacterium]